jgi:hypothetical protein
MRDRIPEQRGCVPARRLLIQHCQRRLLRKRPAWIAQSGGKGVRTAEASDDMQVKYVNAIRELVHHTLMRYNLAMLPTLLCHGPAAMQGLGTMLLRRLGPVLAWQPTRAKSWSLRSLLLRHVRRRVGSGKHKSGSSSSRDRCIPPPVHSLQHMRGKMTNLGCTAGKQGVRSYRRGYSGGIRPHSRG